MVCPGNYLWSLQITMSYVNYLYQWYFGYRLDPHFNNYTHLLFQTSHSKICLSLTMYPWIWSSEKYIHWRYSSIILKNVAFSNNFFKQTCFLWIISFGFCYNFAFAGRTENPLMKQDMPILITLAIALSISLLINLILIGCGVLLCRYVWRKRIAAFTCCRLTY